MCVDVQGSGSAPPPGHEHEHVLPGQGGLDDLPLLCPEALVAEDELVGQLHQGQVPVLAGGQVQR